TAAGTSGQILIASTTGDPQFSTITSSGGTVAFSVGPNSLNIEVTSSVFTFPLPVQVTNGGTGRTVLTTFGVLLGEGSNNINVTAAGTSGQILIASTTGDPQFSTITSSGGTVTFAVGPNSLNIETVNSGGLSWITTSTSGTLQKGLGYICIGGGGLTFALPTTPSVGTQVGLALFDPVSTWTIQLTGQTILFGDVSVSVSLQSSEVGDGVSLVYVTDTPVPSWIVINAIGNLTTT
ncbi:MAG: hypothetical protein Q8L68_04295, partial [Methylococcales bacterium]|nr:hypothetical protein [Methylococcales bacterium]